MPNPKFTVTVDQELLDALKAHTAALNRFCAMQPAKVVLDVAEEPAVQPQAIPSEPNDVPVAPAPAVPPQAIPSQPNDVPVAPAPSVAMPAFPMQTAPSAMPQPAPMWYQTPAPAAPVMPASSAPATSAPAMPVTGGTITLESLMRAGVELMNRNVDVTAILREFGVAAASDLPQNQYAAFAARLRQLGANI